MNEENFFKDYEVQETKNLTFGETQDTNKYRPKSSNFI